MGVKLFCRMKTIFFILKPPAIKILKISTAAATHEHEAVKTIEHNTEQNL